MALVLKQKVEPKLQEKTDLVCFATQVDELGAQQEELRKVSKAVRAAVAKALGIEDLDEAEKRLKELNKDFAAKKKELENQISAANKAMAVDETFLVDGGVYKAKVGKAPKSRSVFDPALAIQILEDQKAGLSAQLVKFNLTDLDAYLTPDELEAVVETSHGTRPVELVRKQA